MKKSNKKEPIVSEPTNAALLTKKIEQLEKDVAAYKASSLEMGNEIASLKRQISGFKSNNERYRKQVSEQMQIISNLNNSLANARAYGEEADELYERKIAELDENKALNLQLQREITAIKKEKTELKNKYDKACVERNRYKTLYESFFDMPWYKRIFAKK